MDGGSSFSRPGLLVLGMEELANEGWSTEQEKAMRFAEKTLSNEWRVKFSLHGGRSNQFGAESSITESTELWMS